ncbi:TipAS antibiotic-recognition domain-containing protein [Nonomuraea rubra]|uniref:TipAS antibiotic-recognition domain-containing protein n=1 Tax=Nonomuraea rubra TaxID=46180 RepID=UPI003CD0A626
MDAAENTGPHLPWCYECDVRDPPALGEMYVSDPRFTSSLDATTPAWAAYLRPPSPPNASATTPDSPWLWPPTRPLRGTPVSSPRTRSPPPTPGRAAHPLRPTSPDEPQPGCGGGRTLFRADT